MTPQVMGLLMCVAGGRGKTRSRQAQHNSLILQGESELQVYSEVIGPFNLMPRAVLQGGGSAVMSALVRTLLPLFMRR